MLTEDICHVCPWKQIDSQSVHVVAARHPLLFYLQNVIDFSPVKVGH